MMGKNKFSIASHSKQVAMRWYFEGKLKQKYLKILFKLHPEWREA